MKYQKHCPGCFHEKAGRAVCPTCGYDEAAPRSSLFLPHGVTVGEQYRVGRVLGKPGGFGVTYVGWDIYLQQRVAIKEFLPRDVTSRCDQSLEVRALTPADAESFEEGKEQFLREARIVAQFDHPSVVRVRNFFKANGTAYMVMDYYEGMSLWEYFTHISAEIEADLAIRLIRPVLDGLQYVHERGVIHRDLKPQNIYLATLGRIIVLDFGAARKAHVGEGADGMSVVVTEGYAPLEQYQRRGQQGAWTDVYSAAATVYRMIVGRPPAMPLDRLGQDVLEANHLSELPAALRPAMRKALAVRPQDRYQSAREFSAALDECLRPLAIEVAQRAKDAAEPVEAEPPRSSMDDDTAPANATDTEQDSPWGDERALTLALIGGTKLPPPPPIPPQDEFGHRRDLPLSPPTHPAYNEITVDSSGRRVRLQSSWLRVWAPATLLMALAAIVLYYALQNWPAELRTARAYRDAPAEQVIAEAPRQVKAAVVSPQPERAPAEPLLLPTLMPLSGGSVSIGDMDGTGQAVERPVQSVQLKGFAMGKTEITVAQYGQFIRLTGYSNPLWSNYPCDTAGGRFPSWDQPGYPQSEEHPAVCVSWVDAQAYVTWLSKQTGTTYRLPTEAEWEYTARAGTQTRYWWGEQLDTSKASCAGCASVRTSPQRVASWPLNPWGLADLSGNVAEWTCSTYAPYANGEFNRCAEAGDMTPRSVRGGSWLQPPDKLRSAARDALPPHRRNVWTGFRVVRESR